MTKHFCDRCEKDCTDGANQFSLKCHIVEGAGYVDRKMNAVSGRLVDYLLCNYCYNVVAGAAFKAFKTLTLWYGRTKEGWENGTDDGRHLLIDTSGGAMLEEFSPDGKVHDSIALPDMPTRGHVRRLLAALSAADPAAKGGQAT